jgi:TolA-binding protein
VVYAAYQCAVSYGLISNNAKKISILESIYGQDDKSLIYPKAVYELGRTYVIVGSDDRAEEIFTYMLEELDNPLYNSKALLELGMLEVNKSNHSKALDYLTQIVEKMPLSQETEDALAVIESIYLLKNKPDDYMAYLEKVGRSAEKDENDIELVYFNAAEQVFLSGDYQQSYKSLTSFLEKYPNGLKASLAHFYLAQTLSELGRKEAAANEYLEVVNSGEGSFVELSLLNYSNICYSMEKYAESANGYLSLYEVAKLGNNKYLAVLGMMRSNFHNEKYQSAIEAVSYMDDFPNKPENDIIEADYIAAKSYIALGQRDKALEIMKKLSEHKLLAYGAEATYILIQDTFDKGEFEEVENMVYAFSDSATNQMYWLAKSFIVLGDAFAELGDLEQAKATFTSIKDEYTPSSKEDDIIEQVNVRLERLEKIISEGIYNE